MIHVYAVLNSPFSAIFTLPADSLIVGSLPGEDCDIAAPEFRVRGGVSFAATDHKLGIMMSSFNQRRSKMDGTGAWHLSKSRSLEITCCV